MAELALEAGASKSVVEVGYESEAAFNRAFKREFALPPAKYRRKVTRQ
jgi:AraC-like DNA-binding protein